MIHDITINSDFAKNNSSNITIDIFNNYRYQYMHDNDEEKYEEFVLTGTAIDREYKQYLKDIERPIRNRCDCCGGVIDIKLWNLKMNDGNLTLCNKCDTRLSDEFDAPTIVIKPWDNFYENVTEKIEQQRRIKDLFLWD